MPKPQSKETSKQKPVHEIRLGRIKATIWENATEKRDAVQRHRLPTLQGRRRMETDRQFWPRRSAPGGQGGRFGSHVDLRAGRIALVLPLNPPMPVELNGKKPGFPAL